MITLSRTELRDRIYACWIGKNIGGTLGTPYEGTRELLDIHGFASEAGEPLPNDDLDLQLAWLRAVNDLGPENINSKTLSEYWISFVNPNWNEYGVGKSNLRQGIPAPMSGEFNNKLWRDSNGAWIRTEVWACLYPAMPDKAVKYAFEDASVDHGFGEGTYAAIFIAAMQSAAFVVHDVRKLLDIGLSKLPEDCRVVRSVRLVMDCYENGVSWKECRERIVEDSADLGWFQAPANVAYVVLGLLYGEGDFKQSMIYAVNCGDDTDCTGATIGALMGIMGGMDFIPKDWMAYIGEGIKSICLTNGHGRYPLNCTELTDCIFNLLPVTLRKPHQQLFTQIDRPQNPAQGVEIGDETAVPAAELDAFYGNAFALSLAQRKPYSYTVESIFGEVLVSFDEKPVIQPNGTLTGTVRMHSSAFLPEQKHYQMRYFCPEGWSVEGPRNLYCPPPMYMEREGAHCTVPFAIHAGEGVLASNTIVLQMVCPGRPTQVLVPIQIYG